MRSSRRSLRVLTYGAVGAGVGALAFAALGAVLSTNVLSILNGIILGVIAGVVLGVLPAAERIDGEQDRRMEHARHGETGPADATFEGQEARDLEAHEPGHRVRR
jgi:zinc transporter ZupT